MSADECQLPGGRKEGQGRLQPAAGTPACSEPHVSFLRDGDSVGGDRSRERKIFRDSSRFAPRPAPPDTGTPVSTTHQPVAFSAGLEVDAGTPSQPTAIQPLQTLRSGSTLQSPTAIQPVLAIQPALTLTQPKQLGQLTRTSLRPAYECNNNPLAYTCTTNAMATSSESWPEPTVSPFAAATCEPPSATPMRHLRPVISGAVATMMHTGICRATLPTTMATAGMTLPRDTYPKSRGSGAAEVFLLDVRLRHALSEYVRLTGASLPAFVELFRGQTAEDYRPNKNLDQESITRPDYDHCDAVATETIRAKHFRPGAEVKLMARDVASAFRNISIHSKSVYRCAGLIEEALQYPGSLEEGTSSPNAGSHMAKALHQ
ncbi:unnamed protein product [Phytophthora fragariaefolia]|uniref:Unnamed protein product n=1 Tax=Phytophthora fragariaefolia TaxID=1490495 RepID=A0A9W6XP81_9STRA|nr:unnamed protein product [Phytophthora fragariaefolia]